MCGVCVTTARIAVCWTNAPGSCTVTQAWQAGVLPRERRLRRSQHQAHNPPNNTTCFPAATSWPPPPTIRLLIIHYSCHPKNKHTVYTTAAQETLPSAVPTVAIYTRFLSPRHPVAPPAWWTQPALVTSPACYATASTEQGPAALVCVPAHSSSTPSHLASHPSPPLRSPARSNSRRPPPARSARVCCGCNSSGGPSHRHY